MPTVIGARCWCDRYAYVIMSGTSDRPKLVKHDHVQLPVNEPRGAQLATLRNVVLALLTKHGVTKAVFKTAEGNSKTSDTIWCWKTPIGTYRHRGIGTMCARGTPPSQSSDTTVRSRRSRASRTDERLEPAEVGRLAQFPRIGQPSALSTICGAFRCVA